MNKQDKDIIEVEPIEKKEEKKPTLERGNYIVEIISEGKVIKRVAAANSEINIVKLADGGLAVDLK